MNFLKTFRVRLLIILAILLIATLSVQYYLNLQTERQNEQLREVQEQALVAGIALGFNGMVSSDRLRDFVKRDGQTFFDDRITQRIKDIIVVNNKWEVNDSLSDTYLPTQNVDGETVNLKLKDITDLPPLVNAYRLGEDRKNFPNSNVVSSANESEAHAIPIETTQGRWYVMVILKTDKQETFLRAAQPLLVTLGVLLISTLITVLLVWRFTRPIAQLSDAAKKVAEGDLRVRVRENTRGDELGQLAARFNEMTAELEKKGELEAQLQQAEKSAVVGRLASAIAHEIRNPLNYINLTLDQLRAKFVPEDEKKAEIFEKLTGQLKNEVERINQLVSDFLRYSRPLKLDLRPVKVRDAIENSLRIVEGQAEEQEIKISVVEHENASQILGDSEVLRSVFNNLFINAVQAMPAGGKLNVVISNDDKFAKIEVADTGEGISAENLPKIFEPYFSTKETGTGLGLAIVKRIIDEHNGTIEVESVQGAGTTFTVRLPKA
ncbi:MAG: HAMP domain-containing protein [Pyrinomonadaceae bacterium]|nr:HAMP domain-containing protein [Pyrinomonadaceae bacterium]